jgi:ubiquinone/menaquinone biosynthesis C-methylase UbiE
MSNTNYHQTRFQFDNNRQIVWKTLVNSYFQKFADPDCTVLEVGAGYCDFINNISAKKKYAFDIWDGIRNFANSDVQSIVGSVQDLNQIPDGTVKLIFASNVFEHLTQSQLAEMLESLHLKLENEGKLVIVQPNFKYAYKEYFDDYTHCTIWTDVSLADFLQAHNWHVEYVTPKFMPLSLKSRLPTWPFLIKLYLMLPFKPMGKQMLLVARKQ